ncbi:MAG: LytTR family DNA-binding domain-containing protein [Bacteroidota bacterium]
MKAILVEDEQSAAANLKYLLAFVAPDIQIVKCMETVSDAIAFFQDHQDYHLVFMDIHLADGNSFEILKEVEPIAPIIFTTAYDQYAIQAFKVNSIDYLLKPIREQELRHALQKLRNRQPLPLISSQQIEATLSLIQANQKTFRRSFLVQKGETFFPVSVREFAYFFIQHGIVKGVARDQTTYHLDEKLEDLVSELDPDVFFRANRQFILQRSAIASLQAYFNGRLVVNLKPSPTTEVIVSKANAARFKAWLNDTAG